MKRDLCYQRFLTTVCMFSPVPSGGRLTEQPEIICGTPIKIDLRGVAALQCAELLENPSGSGGDKLRIRTEKGEFKMCEQTPAKISGMTLGSRPTRSETPPR